MATLSIDIPDAKAAVVRDAICSVYGYKDTLPNGSANPQTKAQFVQVQMKKWAQNALIEYKHRQATIAVDAEDNTL